MAASWCLAILLLPQSDRIDAFYVGHSLESDIPDMVMALAGPRFRFAEQNIPGAPLRWQWEEATRRKAQFEPQYQGYYSDRINAETDVLVLIDSVPRGEEPSLLESIDYTARFVEFARKRNPSVRVFYYEPWHHLTSGTAKRYEHDKASPSRDLAWRPRLQADRPKWDRVVAEVNHRSPGRIPVRLIPAGSKLGELDDAIRAGKMPGLTKIDQVFSDEIHLSPLGKYFVACVHFKSIFGESPVGKPFDIKDRWARPYWDRADWAGNTWKKPAANTVRALQEIAAR